MQIIKFSLSKVTIAHVVDAPDFKLIDDVSARHILDINEKIVDGF